MITTRNLSRNILPSLLMFAVVASVQAASTDISNTPLVVSATGTSSLTVQPNVFLMMDDSGSMGWDFMPDDANNFSGKYGYTSSQCNGIYYDPLFTYAPPVDATGASYANSSFTAAWTDGYNTGGGTTNLSTSFSSGGSGTGTAFYYVYTGAQITEAQRNYYNTASTFYQECNSSIAAAPGSAVFSKRKLGTAETTTITVSGTASTSVSSIKVNGVELMSGTSTASTSSTTVAANIAAKITLNGFSATAAGSIVTITGPTTAANFIPVITQAGTMTLATEVFPDTSAAKLTNFANWYSYYRTRILTMKTATGAAFKAICPTTNPVTACGYRVGMATMNNNGGGKFLNLATFDAIQKSSFYTMLYSTSASNSTPLLRALTSAGLMYAYKLPGNALNGVAATDPIQYSCQQNFTILSTDGFWNDATNSTLTGGSVGQQDGTEIRPMYDGANQTSQTVTVTVTDTYKQSVGPYTSTTPWTRTVTTLGAACSTPASVPTNTTTAPMSDNNHSIALGLSATNPDPGNTQRCLNLGTANAWMCRGGNNFGSPAVSSASVTDTAGKTWYLVSNVSGNTNCVTDNTAFGNNYSNSKGVCPGAAGVNGTNVTIQQQSYNQAVSGTNTSVNNSQTTSTKTVQTINGQVQPAVITTAGPVIIPVSTSSAVATDTGAPTGTTTWTVGSTTGPTCTANPPAAGTTAAVAGTVTTTNGATTVTTVSGYPISYLPATYNGNPNPNVVISSSGGTSNTLADVAEYYYMNDLRTLALGNNLSSAPGTVNGTSVSTNNVPSSNLDTASWQHMTTFTLGLGARGRMVYSPTYMTDTSGDFFSVKNGVQANSASGVCSWQANSTTCNWPTPNVSGTPENIDDMWHAAVNGRGTYFAATNPASLSQGVTTALSGVSARTGSSAAATTSNPNVTSGDNFVFSSTFVTQNWTGELVRQQLDLTTGATLSAIDWAAQAQLDANAARTIYTYSSATANKLTPFTAAAFGADPNFAEPHISTLSQFCISGVTCLPLWQANKAYLAGNEYRVVTGGISAWYRVNAAYTSGAAFGVTDTTNSTVVTGAVGANLVNFLRGDRTNEGISTDTSKYFRQRMSTLGDIVNAEAVYVKVPLQSYSDYGYTAYKTSTAARQGMVYAAANDGMLHAFYSASNRMDTNGNIVTTGGTNVVGGNEAWAYIPTLVIPNLYHLADKNYGNNHQYYVDGTPISSDICISNCTSPTATAADWRTILVGGLNAGGNGYYAMDVSNPAAPKALWQFTDVNMGLTFGNPEVAKLKDGTWVVIVTSGYNNVPPPQAAWAPTHVYAIGDTYYYGNSVYTVTAAYTSGATFGAADTARTTNLPVTSGDGKGHLYVLNAYTGALINDINTGMGDTTTPAGLGRNVAHVVNPGADSTIINIYAGDMLGNLWRFNIDPWLANHTYAVGDGYWRGTVWYRVTTGYTSGATFGVLDSSNTVTGTSINSSVYGAQLLATLQGPAASASVSIGNNVQPITTKPQVGLVSSKTMVYVGTGRYLGTSDLSDKSPQSIYGIMDPLTVGATPSTAIYSNPRTVTGFVQQTITTTTCPANSPTTICNAGQIVRTATHNTVNLATDKGWYVDLLDTGATPQNVGERANNDPTLKLGTLGFTTNVPSASSCTVGGTSFSYFFDYRTGSPVSTSTTSVLGVQLGNALATRPVYVRLPNNTVVQLIRLSDGTTLTTNVPIGSGASGVRRVSWRTLNSTQ